MVKFQKNVLLKNHTTFRIGGSAKYFFAAKNKTELIEAIKTAKKMNPSPFPKGDRVKLPFFVLGGGSNLLVSDEGFKGLVIKILNTKYKIQNTKITTEAGTKLAELVNASAEARLSGLEWAVGIPGTVGGAIFGNAGAFGFSMADTVKNVEVFNTRDLKIKNYDLRDCKFGYRNSIFKKNKNLIILSAILQLKKGKKKEIEKQIKENLKSRKEKQPLNFPSAGSVFKNFTPYRNEVSGAGPKELKELKKFKKTGTIPAAWLIEKCGLKGKRVGNVKISEKHANFIVNLGQGTAKDVMRLIKIIKNKVKNTLGVILEEEIQFLGF